MHHLVSEKQFKSDLKVDIPHIMQNSYLLQHEYLNRRPLHSEDNINGLLTHASGKSGREESQTVAFG